MIILIPPILSLNTVTGHALHPSSAQPLMTPHHPAQLHISVTVSCYVDEIRNSSAVELQTLKGRDVIDDAAVFDDERARV